MATRFVHSEKDLATVAFLQSQVFVPSDRIDVEDHDWWLALEDNIPIGFAGVEKWSDGFYYLALIGTMEEHQHRGHGHLLLQRVCRDVKKWGAAGIKSDSMWMNTPSNRMFIKSGFTLFDPEDGWRNGRSLYWIKTFN